MEQLHEHIHQLVHKLTQLKHTYNQQQLLIDKLMKENERLQHSSQKKSPAVPTYDVSNMSGTLQKFKEEKKCMRQLLQQYIQQIDQCITFLEQT